MSGRYDIAQRVKEILDASDPLKYGDTERSRTVELGSTPQLSPDPRLDALATPLLPNTPEPVNAPPPPPVTVPAPPPGAQARGQQEIVDLLNEGKKLQAVKRYRDLTGAGLAEAKAAVEAIEARLGDAPPPPPPSAPAPAGTDMDALAAQVVALVQGGNTIEAIRAYRQATNVGLAEAKDAVDTIAARLRQEPSSMPFTAPPPAPSSLAAARQQEVPAWLNPVVEQLRRGNKIGAIKTYREVTNVGLAEAKETVEALERQLASRQRG